MNDELSDRAHHQPSTPKNGIADIENLVGPQISLAGPLQTGRASWLAGFKSALKSGASSVEKLSLQLAAHDDPDLVAKLAPYERNFAKLRGWLQVGDVLVKTGGFTILIGYVSGAGFTAATFFSAAGVAVYLAAVDHLFFVRAPLAESGRRAMADVGMLVALPSANSRSARWAKVLRLAMSGITGIVLALVIGLKYDHAAIVQREQEDWLTNNRVIIERVVHDFDAKQQLAEKAYRQLLALANKNVSARHREQRDAELARRQGELDNLNAGRSNAIERLIESAPNFIPRDDSFIGHIKAFLEVLWENPAVAVPILLLDLAALSIDLLTATLSLVYIPSAYSAEILRRQLESIVQTTRSAAANLKPINQRVPPADGDTRPPPPPAPPSAENAAPPQPPARPVTNGGDTLLRRGRGRPRKNGLDTAIEEPSHA